MVSGDTIREVQRNGEILTENIIDRIIELGLTVASNKTEVMLFRPRLGRRRKKVKTNAVHHFWVRGTKIMMCSKMKYLGIIIDDEWNFREHVLYAAGKTEVVIEALTRIMPNIRGPSEHCRRLYSSVVHSVMMYAAPVWSGVFVTSRKHWFPLMRLQRLIALRVIAAYRTVSHISSRLLARVIPIDILAECYTWAYWEKKRLWCEMMERPGADVDMELCTLRQRMIQRGLQK